MRGLPDNEVLRGIRLLVTDVDGVLTDGRIHFDASGHELKTFHVHDGAGLVYWHRSGGLSGFLSGRNCQVVADRAQELGVHEVHLGHLDKRPVLEDILSRHDLQPANLAYIGDDLADLPALELAGLAATVSNARPEVVERAHHVTSVPGGQGAVRELVEILLKAQDKWDGVVSRSGLP